LRRLITSSPPKKERNWRDFALACALAGKAQFYEDEHNNLLFLAAFLLPSVASVQYQSPSSGSADFNLYAGW
jgi:hypothetical protein